MKDFLTVESFLIWIASSGGMGVAVTFIVAQIKKVWPSLDGWYAMAVTIGIAVLLGAGATALLQTGAFQYIEPYWSVIVAVATTVGGYLTSQLIYHKAPISSRR